MPASEAFRSAQPSYRPASDPWWVLCLIRAFSSLPKNISENDLTNPARHAKLCVMKITSAPKFLTGDGPTAPSLASVRRTDTPDHSLRGGSSDCSLGGQSKNSICAASRLGFLAQPAQFRGFLFGGRICCFVAGCGWLLDRKSLSQVRLADGAMLGLCLRVL